MLRGVDGISFTFFEARDVVRHPLVARIVNAYEAREATRRRPDRKTLSLIARSRRP